MSAPEIPTLVGASVNSRILSFHLTGGLVALFISTATNLAMPAFFGIIIQIITDAIVSGKTEKAAAELLNILIYLLIIFSVGGVSIRTLLIYADYLGVAATIRGWLFTLAGQSLVTRIRKLLFTTILKQDVSFFDQVLLPTSSLLLTDID